MQSAYNSYDDVITHELDKLQIQISSLTSTLLIQNSILSNIAQYNSHVEGFLLDNVIFKLSRFEDLFNKQNELHNFKISLVQLSVASQNEISFFDINTSVRHCQKGEVYSKEFQNGGGILCTPCKSGYYSFTNPMNNVQSDGTVISILQCSKCPYSATHCYGSKIFLKEGYWRSSHETNTIFECYNRQQNCLATTTDFSFNCNEGHLGPLCESCDNFGIYWNKSYTSDSRYGC